MTISIYDYIFMGIYLVFMVSIGLVYKSRSKNISDYFRSGGSIVWWLVGASAFVTVFSAWTFVGCAGKVYRSGTIAGLIFLFNAISLIFTFWLAPRLRRLRVITWVSAIKDRFGNVAEQFYAWITMIIGFSLGGVGLYTLAVFMSPIFNISIILIIVIIGLVVIAMAALGGASGLIASDFVQCLIIIFVAITSAFLVLRMPEVGGVSGLLKQIPEQHFNWSQVEAKQILWLWGIAIFINSFISTNNLQYGAARYITVRNEKHARLATVIPFFGMLLLPIIAFIPPLAATFVVPNINEVCSGLNNPSEAAYVVMAMKVLPKGMIGLLACAIFAASLTSMNMALSINASVFVKNIYQPIFRKSASGKELLVISKVTVVFLGLILIIVGIKFSEIKDLPLFEFTLLISGLISIPLMIPLFLGLLIKNTPSWSSWTTVLVGMLIAAITGFLVPPEFFSSMFNIEHKLTHQEIIDIKFATTIISVTVISTGWFLFTMLFYRKQSSHLRDNVDEFFNRLKTPIDEKEEGVVDSTRRQASTVGWLCMIYGTIIMIGILIPNSLSGRMCFVFCGGSILGIGAILFCYSKKIDHKKDSKK